jgi:hypothetical protein
MNIPDLISETLETSFFMWIRIQDPEFFLTLDLGSRILDPGWKNSETGSGINIPDLQHYPPQKKHSYESEIVVPHGYRRCLRLILNLDKI